MTRKCLLISVAIAIILLSLRPWIQFSRQAAELNPHLSTDEGFVSESILKTYEGGYWSYRCDPCYGPVQPFVDTVILKLLPRSLVEEGKQLEDGQHWPWLARYPGALRIVRYERIATVFLLASALFILVLRTAGAAPAWVLTAFFMASPYVPNSFEGIKPDLPSALVYVFFLLFTAKWIEATEERSRRKFFLLATLVGIVDFCTRPGMVLPFAFSIVYYPALGIIGFRRKQSLAALSRDLFVSLGAAGALYLILNPNLFASWPDARWFVQFFHMAHRHPSLHERLREIYILKDLILILLPLLFLFLPPRASKKWSSHAELWLYLAVSLALLTAPVLLAAYGSPYYYLPVIVTEIFAFSRFMTRDESLDISTALLGLLLCSLALEAWHPIPHARTQALGVSSTEKEFLAQLERNPKAAWLIDRGFHPDLPEESARHAHFVFFDSISESPAEVLSRSALPGTRMLVSCWGESPHPASAEGGNAPATELWARLTRDRCPQTQSIDPGYVAVFDENVHNPFATIIPADEILAAAKGQPAALPLSYHEIHPRILIGSEDGRTDRKNVYRLDYNEKFIHSPEPLFIFSRSFSLSNRFMLPQNTMTATELRVPIRTDCLGSVSIAGSLVSLGASDGHSSPQSVQASGQELACRDYPRLCARSHSLVRRLQRWGKKNYAIGELVFPLENRSFSLLIQGKPADDEACTVSLGIIRWK